MNFLYGDLSRSELHNGATRGVARKRALEDPVPRRPVCASPIGRKSFVEMAFGPGGESKGLVFNTEGNRCREALVGNPS